MKTILRPIGRIAICWILGLTIYFTVIGVFGLATAIVALIVAIAAQVLVWKRDRNGVPPKAAS